MLKARQETQITKETKIKRKGFYGIVGKEADVSPDGKLLLPSLDTRNTRVVISALPVFGRWGRDGVYGSDILTHSVKNSASTHRFSMRHGITPVEPAHSCQPWLFHDKKL